MSGLPLFQKAPVALEGSTKQAARAILVGTAVRTERFFDGSIFASASVLKRLIEQLERGKLLMPNSERRTYIGDARWRMRSEVSYRTSHSLTETTFCKNSFFQTTGRGGQGDGGALSTTPQRQPLPCMGAGVLFEGKTRLGFFLNGKSVYADYTSIQLVTVAKENWRSTLFIEDTQHLADLLVKRLAKSDQNHIGLQSSCRARLKDQEPTLLLQVNFPSPITNKYEHLKFEIALEPEAFQPEVRVQKEGRQYNLDVRGLLFDRYKAYNLASAFQNRDADKLSAMAHIRINDENDKYRDVNIICTSMR